MDRMLVVVFDTETQAYEGKKALMELDAEGSIGVYADAVVMKNADGTLTVKEQDNYGPLGTLLGTAFGSLIGLLGGPLGFGIGLATGAVAGAAVDLNDARIGKDFIEDVNRALTISSFALVAEIDEKWTTPVDTRMEAIDGVVFRRALSDVKSTLHKEHIAAMRADLAEMKAEQAQTSSKHKAELQEKINKLDSKIQDQLQKAKEKREVAMREEEAKVEVLKAKAAAAKAKAPKPAAARAKAS